MLAQGLEPFPQVMQARDSLAPGQALRLLAPFAPLPLYPHFESAGYSVHPRELDDHSWEILFQPSLPDRPLRELDLRELDPPGPLQHALAAAASLSRGQTLVLHTRFRPVHLLEQLQESGFDWDDEEAGSNHWITHLWRVAQN